MMNHRFERPSYAEFRRRQRRAYPFVEIPAGCEVSFPLPTRRCGEAAYAVFACEHTALPGAPPRYGGPEYWWLIRPEGSGCLLFARYDVQSFAACSNSDVSAFTVDGLAVEKFSAVTSELEAELDGQIDAFFVGGAGDEDSRKKIANLFQAILSPAMLAHYRALSPDFFAWLVV